MEKILEYSKIAIALFLVVSGICLLYISLYLPPSGVIDGSVLNATGQIFCLVGGLLGLNNYFDYKLKRLENGTKN